MGEVFGGRYELVDNIGSGGAGTVWRVWDRRRGAYCAAKLLKQSDAASLLRFIRETGYRIEHPHICAPRSWTGEDDQILFTMDLATGGSVSTMLKDYGALPDWWALIITDQLLQALEAIHERGLIHRDIKPANLLLEATGSGLPVARLADFGIASHRSDPRLTHTTEVVGTPGYMSRLACMGADPEPAQDLYATGCVLAEMLTGRRPVEAEPPIEIDESVPAPIRDFVARLWTDSGHGFASATQARAQLRTLLASTTPATDPVEVFDQVGPLPEGWTPQGPVGAPPVVPVSASSATPPTYFGQMTPAYGGTPATGPGVRDGVVAQPRRGARIASGVLAGGGLLCLVAALILASL